MVVSTNLALSVLVGGLINTGVMYQQFQTLREDQVKTTTLITYIRENQIRGLTDLANIQTFVQNHEQRIAVIEKYIIIRK